MPIDINGGGAPEINTLVGALRRLASMLAQLAVDIADVPVVGKALSTPLALIAAQVGRTADDLTYFLLAYQKLLDALKTGDVTASFEAALDLLIPGWRLLRDDPLAWILDKLGDAYPHSTLFFRNPGQWLLEQLALVAPGLLDLFQDAEAFILGIVQKAIAGLGDMMADPAAWLRTALSELLGVEDSFWLDPFGNILQYILRWIEEHLIEFAKWLYPIAEKIVRYFWEGET